MHQHREYQRMPKEPMVKATTSGFQWMKRRVDTPPALPVREEAVTCADREMAANRNRDRKRSFFFIFLHVKPVLTR